MRVTGSVAATLESNLCCSAWSLRDLYLMAGMALNDIADFKVDKAGKPCISPLPSGAISRSDSMDAFDRHDGTGADLCQWLANPVAACVGVLPDRRHLPSTTLFSKGTFLGPFSMAMGLCRLTESPVRHCALRRRRPLIFFFLPTGSLELRAGFTVVSTSPVSPISRATEVQWQFHAGSSSASFRALLAALGFARGSFFAIAATVLLLSRLLMVFAITDSASSDFSPSPLKNLWKQPSSPPATGKSIGALAAQSAFHRCRSAMLAAGVVLARGHCSVWLGCCPDRFLVKRFYST